MANGVIAQRRGLHRQSTRSTVCFSEMDQLKSCRSTSNVLRDGSILSGSIDLKRVEDFKVPQSQGQIQAGLGCLRCAMQSWAVEAMRTAPSPREEASTASRRSRPPSASVIFVLFREDFRSLPAHAVVKPKRGRNSSVLAKWINQLETFKGLEGTAKSRPDSIWP